MNVRTDFAVLLRIEADEFTLSCREELLGLLADYAVQAIHEDNTEPGICTAFAPFLRGRVLRSAA